MLLVSGTLWLIDSRDDYMLKPIKEWNNEDVLQWTKGLGESVKKDSMEIFKKEVSGCGYEWCGISGCGYEWRGIN